MTEASTNSTTDGVWTIQKILQWTANHFASKNISSARLDAEILLAHVLGCKRLDLYLKFDQPMRENELKEFKALVVRRAKHEPVAYIVGYQEFHGRRFAVGPGVLIPRPETELLVDELKALKVKAPAYFQPPGASQPDNQMSILDVGSGTGCIGITLALEIPNAKVTAIDKSEAGVKFTSENAQALGAGDRVNVVHSDFAAFETEEKFELIVSNPPYIGEKTKDTLQKDVVDFEPHEALFGGASGHELISEWLPRFELLLKEGGLLLVEIGFDQEKVVKDLASEIFCGDRVEILKDLAGHPRFLKIKRSYQS